MKQLQKLQAAAAGLVFISESDHPLEPVEVNIGSSELLTQLRKQSIKEAGAPVEEQTVDYFFRNHVKVNDAGNAVEVQTAQKFTQLVQALKTEFPDVKVYRVGTVQVHAYIIGKLAEGKYGGLKTVLIET
jgi:hypothetical protein